METTNHLFLHYNLEKSDAGKVILDDLDKYVGISAQTTFPGESLQEVKLFLIFFFFMLK